MSTEELNWLTSPEMLIHDELVRLIGIFTELGVTSVRFPGGKPLLWRSLIDGHSSCV